MRQKEAVQLYLYKLVHGKRQSLLSNILLGLLRFMSFIYGLGVMIKLSLYKYGILQQHRLPCRVISLGNITVGGTGKTPTAQVLASTIRDLGYRVVILNRGYRATWKKDVGLVSDGRRIYMSVNAAGDEAYLLAKNLPGVPVVIGRNRSVTGDYAARELKADVVILDDGYQHWQLARDLDIVLIDTLNVFGNNFLLPRGTLREPLINLKRANAFLLTKTDQSTDGVRDALKEVLTKYNAQALIVESVHRPQGVIEIEDWYKGAEHQTLSFATLLDKKVAAFSGIGNPSSFEQTIMDVGAQLVDSVRYPDHHDYTMSEMQDIMERVVNIGAEAILTTEKDAVKIPSEFIHSERALPLYILNIKIEFTEGGEQFKELIESMTVAR